MYIQQRAMNHSIVDLARDEEIQFVHFAKALQEVNVELKGFHEVQDHISAGCFAQTHAEHCKKALQHALASGVE
jgi:hypothetical protein